MKLTFYRPKFVFERCLDLFFKEIISFDKIFPCDIFFDLKSNLQTYVKEISN